MDPDFWATLYIASGDCQDVGGAANHCGNVGSVNQISVEVELDVYTEPCRLVNLNVR